MPKSRRDKKVALTQTKKKVGLETKQVRFKLNFKKQQNLCKTFPGFG